MKNMRRIFQYVWPQWHRLIVVVTLALIVAVLLSVSFMTIIPLMKVMLGREGLHGWVDRKAAGMKYGVSIYLPETMEITSGGNEEILYNLFVTNIQEDGLADKAGITVQDRIVGLGEYLVTKKNPKIPFTTLINEFANTQAYQIPVQIKRFGADDIVVVRLNTPENKEFLKSLGWSQARRITWNIKLALAEQAQNIMSFVPRERTDSNKRLAVIYIIVGITIITVIRCIAKYFGDYTTSKIMQVSINRLREDTFGHAIEMPLGFFSKDRPSDTVSRIIRDTNQIAASIKVMIGRALREPLNALFMLIFALFLNWQLVLIFLCIAPLVIGFIVILGKKMKKATRRSLVSGSEMLAKLQEVMAGLKVVKVYNQQEYERKSFKAINNRLLKQLLKMAKVDAATMPILEVLGMIGGALALVVGVQWVIESQMETSEFFALLILLGVSAESVRKASTVWNKIQEANAAAERVFKIIDQELEKELPNAYDLKPLKEKIEFIDVIFTYPREVKPVLRGINLSIQAGHNVAIVGPNGSGKTTLANLIPRFYDPDSGQILIDGSDIRGVRLKSLRSQIAMVTQNIVTFNDTVAANIAYGKPSADINEIIEAAKRAHAHEFINSLSKGYDTLIGEQGVGLSGGQLQRIVIARAILKDPAVLIFDEATSQVDADSEAKIHDAIKDVMQDRTSFIIAHRFSTVISADIIVVMDAGQIIAQGTHNKLVESCPLYQSLYRTQLVKA